MQVIGGRLGTTMRLLAITTCLLCVQACGAFLAPQVPLRGAAGNHLLRDAHAPAPQCLSTCRVARVAQTRAVGIRTMYEVSFTCVRSPDCQRGCHSPSRTRPTAKWGKEISSTGATWWRETLIKCRASHTPHCVSGFGSCPVLCRAIVLGVDERACAGIHRAVQRDARLPHIAAAAPRRGRASILTSTRMMFDTLSERMNNALNK